MANRKQYFKIYNCSVAFILFCLITTNVMLPVSIKTSNKPDNNSSSADCLNYIDQVNIKIDAMVYIWVTILIFGFLSIYMAFLFFKDEFKKPVVQQNNEGRNIELTVIDNKGRNATG